MRQWSSFAGAVAVGACLIGVASSGATASSIADRRPQFTPSPLVGLQAEITYVAPYVNSRATPSVACADLPGVSSNGSESVTAVGLPSGWSLVPAGWNDASIHWLSGSNLGDLGRVAWVSAHVSLRSPTGENVLLYLWPAAPCPAIGAELGPLGPAYAARWSAMSSSRVWGVGCGFITARTYAPASYTVSILLSTGTSDQPPRDVPAGLWVRCPDGVPSTPSARLRPGWATGGRPGAPGLQVAADIQQMPADCGVNAALLFRVRGSAEDFGTDALGIWAYAAGQRLIVRGWRVRDMQAIYAAPRIPFSALLLGRVDELKRFRDTATQAAPRVKAQLVAAYERCPQRRIVIAGYSLGNIVLRYVVPTLPERIRRQIVSVDLVADPTADRTVDGGLRHPSHLDGRLTDAGIDTIGGRSLWRMVPPRIFSFHQRAYPSDLSSRVAQYCAHTDLVCDFSLPSPATLRTQGLTHRGYAFGVIGVRAANLAP